MNIWKQTIPYLERGERVAFLLVLESIGSSPGRQGFRMIVTEGGMMHGTVGGGIMEQKMVELAKSKLSEGAQHPFRKRQVHRAEAEKERSGMICSGEQTLAFYFLGKDDLPMIRRMLSDTSLVLIADEKGLHLESGSLEAGQYRYEPEPEESWRFEEQLHYTNTAYIFGGGHVGLAMSRTMSQLGFRVVIFDDREGLFTLEQNTWADEKKIIDYTEAGEYVPEGERSYVIVMTFGYRPDEVIMRRLLGKNFAYLGLMGSRHKIDVMRDNLLRDGYREEDWEKVFTPIGIPIHSKTTDEIAISVAAEIIREKNSKN